MNTNKSKERIKANISISGSNKNDDHAFNDLSECTSKILNDESFEQPSLPVDISQFSIENPNKRNMSKVRNESNSNISQKIFKDEANEDNESIDFNIMSNKNTKTRILKRNKVSRKEKFNQSAKRKKTTCRQ